MKKYIIALFLVIASIVLFCLWFGRAWRNSTQKDYNNLILKDSFKNKTMCFIERYKSNNKIHGFDLGLGARYYCFLYENGFDEFVRDGDKLSKASGELKLKVTKKNNQERTFTFEIRECDIPSSEIFDYIYVEKH